MKGKFKYVVLGITTFLVMTFNVHAQSVSSWDDLKTCLSESSNETECVLSGNVSSTESSISVKKEKTLKLNGHKLSINDQNYILVRGEEGNLTIDGADESGKKGQIESTNIKTFYIDRGATFSIDNTDYTVTNSDEECEAFGVNGQNTTFTLGKNASVTARLGVNLQPYTDDKVKKATGTNINIYGNLNTLSFALYIHGNYQDIDPVNGPKINVYSGNIYSSYAPAIYAAGYGIWNISGGNIEGAEGVSIKSGVFNITGGNIKAHGQYIDNPQANYNGSELTGSAISITSNESYAGEIEISIDNDVVVESKEGYAIFEGTTSGDKTKVKKLDINDGTFTGGNSVGNKALNIESKDEEIFEFALSGGQYSSDISEYLGEDSGYSQNENGLVGKVHSIIAKAVNGTINIVESAITGEEVTVTYAPTTDNYELDKFEISDNVITIEDVLNGKKFIMPDGDVTITVSFKEKTIEPEPEKPSEEKPSETQKPSDKPQEPSKEKEYTTEFEDNDVVFESENALDSEYKLVATLLEKTDEEIDKIKLDDYQYVLSYDISMFYNNELIEMKNGNYTIKIPVNELYDTYKVAYIKDGKVVEEFDASYENGYVVFTTTHLSEYAVYVQNKLAEEITANPQTNDNIISYFGLAILSLGFISISLKKLLKN